MECYYNNETNYKVDDGTQDEIEMKQPSMKDKWKAVSNKEQ